jgi:hypothetical protein
MSCAHIEGSFLGLLLLCVKSIVSYERFGNVVDAVFSLAVYVSFFFFLEF